MIAKYMQNETIRFLVHLACYGVFYLAVLVTFRPATTADYTFIFAGMIVVNGATELTKIIAERYPRTEKTRE